MGVARSLIHELRPGLTSEEVRAAMQADVRGARLRAARRRDRLPRRAVGERARVGLRRDRRGRAVVVDIWPRDKASRCWADMTRTFVAGGGEPPEELAEYWRLTTRLAGARLRRPAAGRQRAQAVRALLRAYIEAGKPTQLTKEPGTVLEDGYFHGLGHGVGLEVHERPYMGRLGDDLRRRRRRHGRAGLLPARLRRLPAGGPRAGHRGRLRGPDRFPVRPVTYPEAT